MFFWLPALRDAGFDCPGNCSGYSENGCGDPSSPTGLVSQRVNGLPHPTLHKENFRGRPLRFSSGNSAHWAASISSFLNTILTFIVLLTTYKGEEQEAISVYEPLGRIEFPWPAGGFPTARYTLLEITPKTGRWHQIRRHLAHIRHPVVGDTGHGDGKHNRLFREHLNIHRLMLHASSLSFPEPETGQALTFRLRPDRSFSQLFPDS